MLYTAMFAPMQALIIMCVCIRLGFGNSEEWVLTLLDKI